MQDYNFKLLKRYFQRHDFKSKKPTRLFLSSEQRSLICLIDFGAKDNSAYKISGEQSSKSGQESIELLCPVG